jgi:hypothetical protein
LTEIEKVQPASAAELRREISQQLPQLDPGLRLVAEDVMGLASPIDLVAIGARGEVVLLLLALEGENDAALLTRCLAQRAWLTPRVRDWAKLAPELELSTEAPVRAILLAPAFGAETRAAAASLRSGVVQLVRYVSIRAGGQRGLLLEPIAGESRNQGRHTPGLGNRNSPEMRSTLPGFRSHLSDSDLGVKPGPEEPFDE